MSRGVAQGGIMSLPKVSYSKETQEMLKRKLLAFFYYLYCIDPRTVMMAESKLTNFQQRKLQQTLKGDFFV